MTGLSNAFTIEVWSDNPTLSIPASVIVTQTVNINTFNGNSVDIIFDP